MRAAARKAASRSTIRLPHCACHSTSQPPARPFIWITSRRSAGVLPYRHHPRLPHGASSCRLPPTPPTPVNCHIHLYAHRLQYCFPRARARCRACGTASRISWVQRRCHAAFRYFALVLRNDIVLHALVVDHPRTALTEPCVDLVSPSPSFGRTRRACCCLPNACAHRRHREFPRGRRRHARFMLYLP